MAFDLDRNERAALAEVLIEVIDGSRFPQWRRTELLRGILAKVWVGSAPPGPQRARP
jgi:hypothetical protein